MKLFNLVRYEDETGVSGTGIVAKGVILPSGKAVMEWITDYKSIATYDSIEELEAIHGHGGKTKVEFENPINVNGLKHPLFLEHSFIKWNDFLPEKTYQEKLEELIKERDLNVWYLYNIGSVNEDLYKDVFYLLKDFKPLELIVMYGPQDVDIQSVSISIEENGELYIDILFEREDTNNLYLYSYKTTNKRDLRFYRDTRFDNFYEED